MTPHTQGGGPVRVGLIGAGVIGSGWAATCLGRGDQVLAHDPADGAETRTRAYLTAVWPLVRRAIPSAPKEVPHGRMTFTALADAVDGVVAVHESGPESVPAKRAIYAAIEAEADPGLLILSSSGGLMPSELQAEMTHPERLAVAHPLSPVYALPLVELLGGRLTSQQSLQAAETHLTRLGKRVVRLRREVSGYLTNRLTFALVREAVHCLMEGVAGPADIEDAVVYGVTPRWVQGGALTSLTLAGGPAGMRGVVDHFSSAIDGWWNDLGTPTMTPEVATALIAAADQITAGRSPEQLLAQRDEATVALVERFHAAGPGAAN
jgi:3-hydroxyacyl-CoA dehydrogenase